jgi:hypothetical protein
MPADDESVACPDCGLPPWHLLEGGRLVHEDFYVDDELWDAVCPDDEVHEWTEDGTTFREGRFVMCIGCFERRLGRELTRADFTVGPNPLFGIPPSSRFLARWSSSGG